MADVSPQRDADIWCENLATCQDCSGHLLVLRHLKLDSNLCKVVIQPMDFGTTEFGAEMEEERVGEVFTQDTVTHCLLTYFMVLQYIQATKTFIIVYCS